MLLWVLLLVIFLIHILSHHNMHTYNTNIHTHIYNTNLLCQPFLNINSVQSRILCFVLFFQNTNISVATQLSHKYCIKREAAQRSLFNVDHSCLNFSLTLLLYFWNALLCPFYIFVLLYLQCNFMLFTLPLSTVSSLAAQYLNLLLVVLFVH